MVKLVLMTTSPIVRMIEYQKHRHGIRGTLWHLSDQSTEQFENGNVLPLLMNSTSFAQLAVNVAIAV